MNRRRLLGVFSFTAVAAMAGCAPDNIDPACYKSAGCSLVAASAGLNQFDLLELIYNGTPPVDRRFAFEVLRGDQFVEPDPSEFQIAAAPEGTAAERSYDPNQTELYIFAEGETVVFYEVFDS